MAKREQVGTIVKRLLVENGYHAQRCEVGSDAKLSKNGMQFTLESYEVKGVGHFCILNMNAMLGLMKMETVVLAPREKDIPMINLDWIGAMGNETQLNEIYNNQLSPYPEEKLAAFAKIKENDADLSNYESGEHWYDDLLYPCSYAKTGKGCTTRYQSAAKAYAAEYIRQMKTAEICDPKEKSAKTKVFAENLIFQGGPAVNQMKKLFGDKVTERIILSHMYGVK